MENRMLKTITHISDSLLKFNPNHGKDGRFASGSGGKGSGASGGGDAKINAEGDMTIYYDDDGREVPAEAHFLAAELIEKANAADKQVTEALQAHIGEGYLQGLDFRIKSQGSLDRKIRDDAAEKNISFKDAADNMGDVLRFTAIFEPKNYTQSVNAMRSKLQANGFTEVKHKDFWGEQIYQGINSNWKSPSGQIFELQYHTAQSFSTKEATHKAYELYRRTDTPIAKKEELWVHMARLQSYVEKPYNLSGKFFTGNLSAQALDWKKFFVLFPILCYNMFAEVMKL